ncbi:hypothetical protein Pyn_29197 [Prunus yedoensis var. nudiflora]|uniref:Uncharacterized protein n=1 Tax=Prunus yedoensis var. nudiflora TaxID=2094558 RepID=A0A314UAM3_PRUYE|nr:hypothetical protein Pyn_29197 [Prunus yedoensis var. nudiflora]
MSICQLKNKLKTTANSALVPLHTLSHNTCASPSLLLCTSNHSPPLPPQTRPDLFFSDSIARNASLHRRKLLSVRCSGDSSSMAAVELEFNAKVFRKNLTRSKNYNHRGFGHKEATLELMNRNYTTNRLEYTWGNVTVKLAETHRFCWDIERAIQIAYEARKQFPDYIDYYK